MELAFFIWSVLGLITLVSVRTLDGNKKQVLLLSFVCGPIVLFIVAVGLIYDALGDKK